VTNGVEGDGTPDSGEKFKVTFIGMSGAPGGGLKAYCPVTINDPSMGSWKVDAVAPVVSNDSVKASSLRISPSPVKSPSHSPAPVESIGTAGKIVD
jgi:hypothetical protein